MLFPCWGVSLEVGPFPRGGDGTTVSATGGQDDQTGGGSLKIVAATERGRYFPVADSRGKVESVAETTTTLSPAGPSSGRHH